MSVAATRMRIAQAGQEPYRFYVHPEYPLRQGCGCGDRACGWALGVDVAYKELVSVFGSAEAAGLDAFVVSWAAPLGMTNDERVTLLCGWLRAHGIDPKGVVYRPNSGGGAVSVCVAEHPVLGSVIVWVEYVRDAARNRLVTAYGSHTEVARRVCVQPLGMPPPPSLRVRGEARAESLGLRLPVAALLSGGARRAWR